MKKITLVVVILFICILLFSCAFLPGDYTPIKNQNVYFGTYGGNPIEWEVLKNDGSYITMITSDILFNDTFDSADRPWDSSDLKTKLNGSAFYDGAFSALEKAAIDGTAGNQVKILSEAEATSYYSDDAERQAQYSGANGMWWLSDDMSGRPDGAQFVFTDGTIKSDFKIISHGVRPVIKVKISAITLTGDMTDLPTAGKMKETAMVGTPQILCLNDPSMPTLTVNGYTLNDSAFTVDVTPSAPLAADEKVYCLLYHATTGGLYSYFGWSDITGGKVTFTDFQTGKTYASAILMVGKKSGANQTCYTGNFATITSPAASLSITGITNFQSFTLGDTASFQAVGWGMSNAIVRIDGKRIIPARWELSNGTTGSWSAAPYTGQLSGLSVGDYTLKVYFQHETYNSSATTWSKDAGSTDEMRSVQFTVKAAPATPTPPPAAAGSFSVTPPSATLYMGGRTVLTPQVKGGAWSYDKSLIRLQQNADGSVTVTALKPGTVSLHYTVGWADADITLTIKDKSMPQTGQDFTPILILLLCAGCALSAAFVLKAKNAKA